MIDGIHILKEKLMNKIRTGLLVSANDKDVVVSEKNVYAAMVYMQDKLNTYKNDILYPKIVEAVKDNMSTEQIREAVVPYTKASNRLFKRINNIMLDLGWKRHKDKYGQRFWVRNETKTD